MAKKDDELEEEKKAPDKKEKKEKKQKEQKKEEESSASKVVTALIIIVIVLIWLGVFAVLIKADVGGFGSKVLAPVLQDVPVINKILPEGAAGKDSDSNYDYTLDEAIEKIKELQMQLDSQNSSSGVDSKYITQLEAEVKRLQEFEKNQDEFAKQKKEFDEQVVYADNAPDIEEYKKYYEEIDPDNAAEIYRQVVKDVEYSQKVKDEADKYAQMDPASAAQVLDQMTSADLDMVCEILSCMPTENSALIMQELDSNIAAKITKRTLAKK